MWIFRKDNIFRYIVNRIVTWSKFDYFIIGFIFVSSIILILDSPLSDPNGKKRKILNILDIILTSIFVLEFVMKIIANGFLMNGKGSYLRSSWNILDFLILLISVSNTLN